MDFSFLVAFFFSLAFRVRRKGPRPAGQLGGGLTTSLPRPQLPEDEKAGAGSRHFENAHFKNQFPIKLLLPSTRKGKENGARDFL
jgi:hypothetical protein